ncbi:hypothetical protein [Hymenobacter rigui]|uniref:Uncharacterized protein n=1 Tax=Hymenobacter rigui TaxID=334424 RepID=A0A428KRV3_9BACT|nr:hypothetical protein [Hymenobacter rigui]RSK49246.1 hypothetical protein EI291_07015 [Hymenobacter rigui]
MSTSFPTYAEAKSLTVFVFSSHSKNVCSAPLGPTVYRSKAAKYSCCQPLPIEAGCKGKQLFLFCKPFSKNFFSKAIRFSVYPLPVEAGCKGSNLFAFSKNQRRKSFSHFLRFRFTGPVSRSKAGCKGSKLFFLFPRAKRKKFFGFDSWKTSPSEAGCKGSNFLLTCATPVTTFFSPGLSEGKTGAAKRAGRRGRRFALVARRLAAARSAFRIGSAKVVGCCGISKPTGEKTRSRPAKGSFLPDYQAD